MSQCGLDDSQKFSLYNSPISIRMSGKNIIAADLNEQTGCSAEAYEEKRRGYGFGFKNKERGNDYSTL